jgi:hypothetical protein
MNDGTNTSSSLRAADIVWWVVQWIAWICMCIYRILMGALIFYTIVFGFIGTRSKRFEAVVWIAGAIAGAIHLVWTSIRKGNKAYPALRPVHVPDEPKKPRDPNRALWVTRDAVRTGFWGLFPGIILAFVLVTSWFSIASSPFAPSDWKNSIRHTAPGKSTEFHESDGTDMGGLSSNHPMVFCLFLGPLFVLWLLGFIAGGFGVCVDTKVKHPAVQTSPRRAKWKPSKMFIVTVCAVLVLAAALAAWLAWSILSTR